MPSLGRLAGVFASAVLAVIVGFAAYAGLANYPDIRLTASTVVALAGTLTGFLLTALSLLVGVADRRFIENLRLTGHYQQLIYQIFQAAGLWLVVVALGLSAHLTFGQYQRFLVALAFIVTTLALLKFLSVGKKFRLVVRELTRG